MNHKGETGIEKNEPGTKEKTFRSMDKKPVGSNYFAVFSLVFVIAALRLLISGFRPLTFRLGGGFIDLDWNYVDWYVHFWNFKEAERFLLHGGSFLKNSSEFYPFGVSTLLLHGDLLTRLTGGFLSTLFGIEWAFLFMGFLVIAGNGVGGYILALEASGSRTAALVAALILAFSGMAAWSVNTGNFEVGLWLPTCLAMANMVRFVKTGKKGSANSAAIWGSIAFYMNLTNEHFLLIFVLIIFFTLRKKNYRILIKNSIPALIIHILLVLPVLIMFIISGSSSEGLENPEHQIDFIWKNNSRFLAEYSPVQGHIATESLFGRKTLPDNPKNKSRVRNEDTKVGIVFWILILSSLVATPRKSAPWLFVFSVFFILSLGPYLKIHPLPGAQTYNLRSHGPLLPYFIAFKTIPFFKMVRFPYRIFSFALMGGVVAASFPIAKLESYFKKHLSPGIFPFIITAIVALYSVMAWEIRWSRVIPPSPAYDTVLGLTPVNEGIIEYPFDFGILDSRYLYCQVYHGHPVFNGTMPGYSNSDISETKKLVHNNKFLESLWELQKAFLKTNHLENRFIYRGQLPEMNYSEGVANLRALGFGYLFLHKRITWDDTHTIEFHESKEVGKFLKKWLGDPLYVDDDILVFGIQP